MIITLAYVVPYQSHVVQQNSLRLLCIVVRDAKVDLLLDVGKQAFANSPVDDG